MAVFLATIYCFNPFLVSLLLLVLFLPNFHPTDAHIGVCNNGLEGSNLPSNEEIVDLYKSNGIRIMRMYDPNQQALQALRGSGIELVLGVPNNDLQRLANDTASASKWVYDNIRNYYPDVKFRIIAVGNKVNPILGEPSAPLAQYVFLAMSNIYDAIADAGLKDQIKVSTAIDLLSLLSSSYPPSAGSFEGTSKSFIEPIINFLNRTNNPLLINIYPYFLYMSNPQDFSLSFALLKSTLFVQDGQLLYTNHFDAMLDAAYSAVEKAGGPNVEIVVSETGWPSAGSPAASVENAGTYYRNLVNHVKGGTPKRPGRAIETYLYALFDENGKHGAETEQRLYGLFLPNKQPKYQTPWATIPLSESLVLYCTI